MVFSGCATDALIKEKFVDEEVVDRRMHFGAVFVAFVAGLVVGHRMGYDKVTQRQAIQKDQA